MLSRKIEITIEVSADDISQSDLYTKLEFLTEAVVENVKSTHDFDGGIMHVDWDDPRRYEKEFKVTVGKIQ